MRGGVSHLANDMERVTHVRADESHGSAERYLGIKVSRRAPESEKAVGFRIRHAVDPHDLRKQFLKVRSENENRPAIGLACNNLGEPCRQASKHPKVLLNLAFFLLLPHSTLRPEFSP